MNATANGHIKLINKRQERYYRAEIRVGLEPPISRRRFRTASLAEAYGKRWAERYNRYVNVHNANQNDSKGLNESEGT